VQREQQETDAEIVPAGFLPPQAQEILRPALFQPAVVTCQDSLAEVLEEGFYPHSILSRHESFHGGFFWRGRSEQSPAFVLKLGDPYLALFFFGGGGGVIGALGGKLGFQVNFALTPLAFNDDPRGGRRGRGILWRRWRGNFGRSPTCRGRSPTYWRRLSAFRWIGGKKDAFHGHNPCKQRKKKQRTRRDIPGRFW
jgi:hypothetical protein